jgi:hypothetical protein
LIVQKHPEDNKYFLDTVNPVWIFYNSFLNNINIKIIWTKNDYLIWIITDTANDINNLVKNMK